MSAAATDGWSAAAQVFSDVLEANSRYAQSFGTAGLAGLAARAARGIAVVTCMDSRLDPLRMTGLAPGDAKILRNAGGRVSDDVLRTLVLAVHLLGVNRIMVVSHTECVMFSASEAELHERIRAAGGPDTRSQAFGGFLDQRGTVAHDVLRIRTHPFIPAQVAVEGFVYDVGTGLLGLVEHPDDDSAAGHDGRAAGTSLLGG